MPAPRLEGLVPLDQVIVEQELELLEVFTGCESHNAYRIKAATGTLLFRAREDSNCLLRCCCRTSRPLTLHFEDIRGSDVVLLKRRLRCQYWCCFCCLQELVLEHPTTKEHLGSVKQQFSFWGARLLILDKNGGVLGLVKGPCWRCGNVRFQIVAPNGEKIGIIQKMFSGWAQELATDADNFSVTFPRSMTPIHKVLLIGATFLIDYMYFEEAEGNCCCCCCPRKKLRP